MKLEKLGPVGPKKLTAPNLQSTAAVRSAGLFKFGIEKRLFMLGRAFALVGNHAGSGGSKTRIARKAARFFAGIDYFFPVLSHSRLVPGF